MLLKGKLCFIKYDMLGYIKTTSSNVETFVPRIRLVVAKKNTQLRVEGKFMCIVKPQERPTLTSKNLKSVIVGAHLENKFK